jgi:hypothetical protein
MMSSPACVAILALRRYSYRFEVIGQRRGVDGEGTFTAGRESSTHPASCTPTTCRTKFHMDVTGAGIGTIDFEDDSAMGVRLSSPMYVGRPWEQEVHPCPNWWMWPLSLLRVRGTSSMDVDVGPVVFPPVHLPHRLAFLWLQLDLKNHNEYDFVSKFLIDIRQPVKISDWRQVSPPAPETETMAHILINVAHDISCIISSFQSPSLLGGIRYQVRIRFSLSCQCV